MTTPPWCREKVMVYYIILFLLYTSELFLILEDKLIGYADDSTLIAVVPSPGVRVTVAESLIRDLGRVCEWCDLCWMKLNASQTKTMITMIAASSLMFFCLLIFSLSLL